MDFIEKWVAKALLAFKTGNPKIWALIALIATVLQFGVRSVLVGVPFPDEWPVDLLSLDWFIRISGLQISDQITDMMMWFLALLLGSKGTTAFMKPEKQVAAIAASQDKTAELHGESTVSGIKEAVTEVRKGL